MSHERRTHLFFKPSDSDKSMKRNGICFFSFRGTVFLHFCPTGSSPELVSVFPFLMKEESIVKLKKWLVWRISSKVNFGEQCLTGDCQTGKTDIKSKYMHFTGISIHCLDIFRIIFFSAYVMHIYAYKIYVYDYDYCLLLYVGVVPFPSHLKIY